MTDKRRGHNEGSVWYEEAQDRWIAAVTIAPGKRKRVVCKTKKEALEAKSRMLRELDAGTIATKKQRKLAEFLQEWLDNKPNLRISTRRKYQRLVNYIVADLGSVTLSKLTAEQVQKFITKKLEDGLASKTVHQAYALLRLAVSYAVKWGYVSRNVVDLVDAPRMVSRKGTPLTVEQAKNLLAHLKGHRLEMVVLTAIVTGMRRGEILALRWADVDIEHRYLIVRRTVDYIYPHGYVEDEPKTKSGNRRIALPEFYIKLLKAHKVKQERQRRKAGEKWENRDLVFADMTGGYLSPSHLTDDFKTLLIQASIEPIHLHDLRHSAATILISMGIHPKVIQEFLGHSDIAVTMNVYGHLFPTLGDGVAEKFDEAFGP